MTNPRPPGPPQRPSAPRPSAPKAAPQKPAAPAGAAPPDETPKKKSSTGTLIGILISVAIVLVIAVVIGAIVLSRNSIGTPTSATTAAGRLDVIPLALDVAPLTAPPAEGPGEALTLYRAALTEAIKMAPKQNIYFLPEMLKTEKEPEKNPKFKPMLDNLLKAADTPYDPLYDLLFPETPVNIKNEFSVQKEIKSLGWCLQYASMSARADGKFDDAEKFARAELVFGLRLWRHGVFVANRSAGLSMISEGLALLKDLHTRFKKNPEKAKIAADLEMQFRPTSVRWKEKENEITRDARYFGADAWNLAQNDQDRTWRIEGIMRLGIARFAPGNSTKAIESYLQKRVDDKDRIIAEKTAEALAFTATDANSIEQEPD